MDAATQTLSLRLPILPVPPVPAAPPVARSADRVFSGMNMGHAGLGH